jgi:hypothetical protein
MICLQCGVQNEDTTSYCRQCGTNLQTVRSALLGLPPAPAQMQPLVNPKYAPVVLILSALFGFLSFGALFGAIIAIIAIGSDPGSRLGTDAVAFLSALVAITGTVGIVFFLRTLMKMVTAMSVAASQQTVRDTGCRTLGSAPDVAALPPPRQPASVVEHTTAHLPNYVRPSRNTGE